MSQQNDYGYSFMEGDSDSARNYKSGRFGQGELNALELAEKFGLDRSEEGRGDEHIWGLNPDGTEVYIGRQIDGLMDNEELIEAHSRQANPEEKDHLAAGESLSSVGDVRGAILNLWKADALERKPERVTKETPLNPRTERAQKSNDIYRQALPSTGNRVFNRDVEVYDFDQYNSIQDYYDSLSDNGALSFSNRGFAGSYRDNYTKQLASEMKRGTGNKNIRQQLT